MIQPLQFLMCLQKAYNYSIKTLIKKKKNFTGFEISKKIAFMWNLILS